MHLKLTLEVKDGNVTGLLDQKGSTEDLAAMLVNLCLDNAEFSDALRLCASTLRTIEKIPRLQIVEDTDKPAQ